MMFQTWIEGNRIALAAFLTRVPDLPPDPTFPDISSHGLVVEFLEQTINAAKARDDGFNLKLPPSTLKLLLDVPPDEWETLAAERSAWQQAYERNLRKIGQARTLAQFIQFGPGDHDLPTAFAEELNFRSVNLIRLLQKADCPSEQEQDLLERKEDIRTLRSPWTLTEAKIDAVARLQPLFPDEDWPQLANALFHQIFIWPLFMSGPQCALSLPVAVDVTFERNERSRWLEDKDKEGRVEVKSLNELKLDSWLPTLEKAARVARTMWRGRHGNFGEFRRKIWQSTVRIDFRHADRIAASGARVDWAGAERRQPRGLLRGDHPRPSSGEPAWLLQCGHGLNRRAARG
jgi:hypothetical protein